MTNEIYDKNGNAASEMTATDNEDKGTGRF